MDKSWLEQLCRFPVVSYSEHANSHWKNTAFSSGMLLFLVFGAATDSFLSKKKFRSPFLFFKIPTLLFHISDGGGWVYPVFCIKADLFCSSHLSGAHVNSESSHSSKTSLTLLCEAITRSCWIHTNAASAIRIRGKFKCSGLTATWLSSRQVCGDVLNVLFLFCYNFIPVEVQTWPKQNLYIYFLVLFIWLANVFLTFRCAGSRLNIYLQESPQLKLWQTPRLRRGLPVKCHVTALGNVIICDAKWGIYLVNTPTLTRGTPVYSCGRSYVKLSHGEGSLDKGDKIPRSGTLRLAQPQTLVTHLESTERCRI